MTSDTPDFFRKRIETRRAAGGKGRGIAPPETPREANAQLDPKLWGGTGGSNPWRWQKGEVHSVEELGGYRPRTLPFGHQIVAAKRMAMDPVFALLMEMGTGKTKALIDEWAIRVDAKEARDLLVVAPAGVYLNWRAELDTHLPEHLLGPTVVAYWRSSAGVTHREALTRFLRVRDRPRVLLVNAEALSTVERARQLCRDFLAQRPRMATIDVDESTLLRDTSSNRTQALVALRELASHRRIATGLPTPKSPLDLYGQFEFLDWRILGQRSFYGYRNRYAVLRKMKVPRFNSEGERSVGQDGSPLTRDVQIVVGYRNVEELRDRIAEHAFRVTKEECLDLPPKLYERRDVELTAEQLRVYDELKRNATSELRKGQHVTATDIMTRRLRLHTVALGFVKNEEGKLHQLPNDRPKQLVELLAEHSGKAIIWAPYHMALNVVVTTLRREYGERAVVRFWGEVKVDEREEAVRRFQQDAEARFIVGNPAALGRGRTLTEASLVVYYGCDADLELRLQSEDRAHRAGLKHSVTYVDMVARGTVEEKNIALLRKKMDLAAMVLGEDPKEWLE